MRHNMFFKGNTSSVLNTSILPLILHLASIHIDFLWSYTSLGVCFLNRLIPSVNTLFSSVLIIYHTDMTYTYLYLKSKSLLSLSIHPYKPLSYICLCSSLMKNEYVFTALLSGYFRWPPYCYIICLSVYMSIWCCSNMKIPFSNVKFNIWKSRVKSQINMMRSPMSKSKYEVMRSYMSKSISTWCEALLQVNINMMRSHMSKSTSQMYKGRNTICKVGKYEE